MVIGKKETQPQRWARTFSPSHDGERRSHHVLPLQRKHFTENMLNKQQAGGMVRQRNHKGERSGEEDWLSVIAFPLFTSSELRREKRVGWNTEKLRQDLDNSMKPESDMPHLYSRWLSEKQNVYLQSFVIPIMPSQYVRAFCFLLPVEYKPVTLLEVSRCSFVLPILFTFYTLETSKGGCWYLKWILCDIHWKCSP